MMSIDDDSSVNIDCHRVHCNNCYSILCKSIDIECCVINCPECSMRLHQCKLDDHYNICKQIRVACINVHYGCPMSMRRWQLADHLVVCPASLLVCGIERNRKCINAQAKKMLKKQHLSSIVDDDNELDVCLARSDQRKIIDSYRIDRRARKKRCDFYNCDHPLLPIIVDGHEAIRCTNDDDDSSDEENRERERIRIASRLPFIDCYLCRVDPSSQHLHTLGNMNTINDANIIQKEVVKTTDSMNVFNSKRDLFVHLTAEHFSPNNPKPPNVYTIHCGQLMRRDEYLSHYRDDHANIVAYSDGFAQMRCPLADQGCDYILRRLVPNVGRIRFDQQMDSFTHLISEDEKVNDDDDISLIDLSEISIIQIAKFVDSASLRALSATCTRLRALCRHRFWRKAMVSVQWTKTSSSKWIETEMKWSFSKCHSSIDKWKFVPSTAAISNHLLKCPFNVRNEHSDDRHQLLTSDVMSSLVDELSKHKLDL